MSLNTNARGVKKNTKVFMSSNPGVSGVHLEFNFILFLHGFQDYRNACSEAHSLIQRHYSVCLGFVVMNVKKKIWYKYG